MTYSPLPPPPQMIHNNLYIYECVCVCACVRVCVCKPFVNLIFDVQF